jgi:hypothetical protein
MALIDQFGSALAAWGLSAAAGAAAGAGLVLLGLRTWVTERIRGQIKGEYDRELESHKADLKRASDIELERLKSQLSIAAAQQNVRFSHLHEKRAEVIREVYASLRTFVAAVAEYTAIFEPVGMPPRKEREKAAVDAANAFVKLYWENKIYIPPKTTQKLDQIRDELRLALIQFQTGVDRNVGGGNNTTTTWLDITKKVKNTADVALVELETDFRTLLGYDSSV